MFNTLCREKSVLLLFFLFAHLLIYNSSFSQSQQNRDSNTLKISEIRIRDPFIYPDSKTKTYYMYAQMSNRLGENNLQKGVEVYTSKNLKEWQGHSAVFNVPNDFWATWMVWAPEVHFYKDKYYLFVTFTSRDTLGPQTNGTQWPKLYKRGTQILMSDSPSGPFQPFRNGPHTPENWQALDGTLFIEDEKPYMIFCHEWVQIKDGTMEFIRLKDDLSGTIGSPVTMFKGSDAPWVKRSDRYITDGPFFYRTFQNELLMIWSSFGEQGYAVGIAVSQSKKLKGPWKQNPTPLFSNDGGHGMIFKTFNDVLVIALHQPNRSPEERLNLYRLKDTGNSLEIVSNYFNN